MWPVRRRNAPRQRCAIRRRSSGRLWKVGLLLLVATALVTQFYLLSTIDSEKQHVQYINGLSSSNRTLTIESIARIWSTPPTAKDGSPYPWCRPEGSSSKPGLIYIKVDKTSSSTLVGINIRLARIIGARTRRGVCSHTRQHGQAFKLLSRGDGYDGSPPLVWTFLRDPSSRAMSHYFHFFVSRRKYGVQYSNMKFALESVKNFQTQYVMIPPNPLVSSQDVEDIVTQVINGGPATSLAFMKDAVLQRYNFIGLVERLDESLAVMKILWNLDVGDLMALAAKQSGGYDDGRFQNRCTKIAKASDYTKDSREGKTISRIQDEYLQTDFVEGNLDYLLYEAVNASLDMTIAQLGRQQVDRTVRELQLLRGRVESECQSTAIFPCSPNGTSQMEASARSCYYFDSGCGFPCVDAVVEAMEDFRNTATDTSE